MRSTQLQSPSCSRWRVLESRTVSSRHAAGTETMNAPTSVTMLLTSYCLLSRQGRDGSGDSEWGEVPAREMYRQVSHVG
jgi:hypothetical protein